jgi:hypothetical protein
MRAILAVLALAFGMSTAAAQEFVLPEGFTTTKEPIAEEGLAYLFTVQPAEGAFAGLSGIRLSRVEAAVEDADAWLEGRLSADVGGVDSAERLFTDPDSPFADPAFDGLRRALPGIFAEVQSLAELPLEFCDGPQTGYNASGAYRELACAFNFGPVRQFLVLRLQDTGGATYFTEIRTMNERRLRHLLAVADTFTAGDI